MAPSLVEHPYAIHSPPAYSSAVAPVIASDPAKHPYSTSTPPAHSSAVSPVHASDPAVHQYAVATPPAHASAVSPVMAAHPAEDPYSVSAPPAHSHPVPAPSHHADPTYGIAAAAQTGASSARPAMNDHSLASGSASPAFHHAKGSENGECAERCEVKCQTADIAFEITQCRTSCLAACTTTEKAENTGVYGSPGLSPGLMFANAAVAAATAPEGSCANSDGAHGSNLKSAVPAGHGHSAPVVGAESNSFDACMRSCKGKMQHADIAGDVSQGKQHCEEACAHLAEAKVTIPVKRDSSVDAPFRPPPPEVEVGSGIVTYESCMQSCGGKWQTAFHISQGEHHCKESCARYAKAGTNLVVKREKSVDAPFRAHEPEVEVGTGFASYEACMKSCGGRWQTAFGISQGDRHCKTSCARYAKAGPEVIARKEKPVDGPFRAPEPEVEIGSGAETFEGCMKSCGGKWQTAFGISQGKKHCQTACARYAKVGPEVIVKKEALPLPAHEKGPFTPPSKSVVDSGFTAFEACSKLS
ncbi:hypothetical protein F4825DRAFT_56179 [Nemania diffusa]|nr:hypothetical protein F4825DRAFT_56179 [Nemania diffusa]